MTRKKPQKYAACSHFKSMNSHWTCSAWQPSCNSSSQINLHPSDNICTLFAFRLPSPNYFLSAHHYMYSFSREDINNQKRILHTATWSVSTCWFLLLPPLNLQVQVWQWRNYPFRSTAPSAPTHSRILLMHFSLLHQFFFSNESFLSIQRCYMENHLKPSWPHPHSSSAILPALCSPVIQNSAKNYV